jgi:WD40-like Beta Propeller Repeat
MWKCKSCKKQFSVKAGTIFEDTPIRQGGSARCGCWLTAKTAFLYGATDRCFTPAISPDGRRVVFAVNRDYREGIWRKSLTDPDAPPAPLLSSTHSDMNPQY